MKVLIAGTGRSVLPTVTAQPLVKPYATEASCPSRSRSSCSRGKDPKQAGAATAPKPSRARSSWTSPPRLSTALLLRSSCSPAAYPDRLKISRAAVRRRHPPLALCATLCITSPRRAMISAPPHLMTSAPSHQPRLGDATPFALLGPSARDPELARLLRIELYRPEAVGHQVLSARIDVPPGEWLLWPRAGYALWVGAGADALPSPVRHRLTNGDAADVIELVELLAHSGVWCRDAALLADEGWTQPRRAEAVFAFLATGGAAAISGVFVDRQGRSARLEVASGGVCWTDRPVLAIEWLLSAVDLPQPV
ncbi:MAG: hypothetical protein V7607_2604 [Solirubrobacteraceae bacterium]